MVDVPTLPTLGAGWDGDPRLGAELAIETVLAGRYRIGPVVRHSRGGVTHVAWDTQLARQVCVASADTVEHPALLEQAQVRARLEHPTIVRVWDAFEDGPLTHVVTERVAGETLAALLRRRRAPFSQAETVEIATQVAVALEVAAGAGLSDVAPDPDDVLRADDGRVVLVDLSPHTEAAPSRRRGATALARLMHILLTGRVPGGTPVPAWRVNPTVSRRASDALHAVLVGSHSAPGSAVELLAAFDAPQTAAPLWSAAVIDVRDEARLDSSVGDEVVGFTARGSSERTARHGPHLTVPFTVGSPSEGWETTTLNAAPSPSEVEVERAPEEVAGGSSRLRSTVATRPDDRDTTALDGGRETPPPPGGPAPFVAHVPAPLRAERPAAPPVERPVRRFRPGDVAPASRPWLTYPLGAAAVALTTAAPALMVGVLAIGVAPALATRGDQLVEPTRSPVWLPLRWIRNTLVGAVRAVIPGAVLLFGLLMWWGTGVFDGMDTVGEVVLRGTGAVVGLVLARSIGRGAPTFRSHVALDDLAVRLMPAGRPTPWVGALIAACALAVATGLSLTPEAWPFPG